MKTGKWGKSGTSNFTPPRDKDEEELWIISANKQREKTPDQLYREGKRLEAIFSAVGRERKSEGRAMAWQEHRQQSKTKVDLAETAKTTNEPTAQGSDSTLDIEATYNKAIERSEGSPDAKRVFDQVGQPLKR